MIHILLCVSSSVITISHLGAFFRNLGNFIQKFKFGLQYVSPGGFLVYFSAFDKKLAQEKNKASEYVENPCKIYSYQLFSLYLLIKKEP